MLVKEKSIKKIIIALIAATIAAIGASAATADTKVVGGFRLESSATLTENDHYSYSPGGAKYALQGWNVGSYTTNGVLTILKSGTYTISMSGSGSTTDRIKIASGVEANITISGLNIAPNQTDGYSDHYGQGRPFDMKGATVRLTLQGTNTFDAPAFSTALFCPANSKLTIDGSGTLNVKNYGKDLCVAGIGGEGKVRSLYTYAGMETADQTIVKGQEQLARLREWPNDGDSRCGDITINGTPKINVELKIGDWEKAANQYEEGAGGGAAERQPFLGEEYPDFVDWCLLKTPSLKYTRNFRGNVEPEITIDLGQTTFLVYNSIVGIGGAYDGSITINGGTVDVKTSVLATGIGSVNRQFGKVKITGGTVTAVTGWKSSNPISFTDYVGSSSIGPAIGWAEYGNSLPSNMAIEITGGTVNAKSSYGAAGIGGGVDSTGGTIIISGGSVTAQGGFNGAGIGSGIGQSITGNTTGEGKIIITGGTVKATGGDNAAGIGGGGNPLGNDKTGGQSGTIIIAGNAAVTAQGGQNAPGIGAGGAQSQNNYNANAAKVQAIIITTTGHVQATGGRYAPTNIGAGKLGNETSPAVRYDGSVIVNTSDAAITNTADMPNLAASDASGNIDVKGSVDVSVYDFVSQYTSTPTEDIVSKAVADKVLAAPTSKINGSGSSTLKISQTYTSQITDRIGTGVDVSGVEIPSWTITVTAGAGGSVAGPTAPVRSGTPVTITATPDSGYVFTRWEEDGKEISKSSTFSFTAEKNRTISAVFSKAPADSGGSGGSGDSGDSGSGDSGSDLPSVDDPTQSAQDERLETLKNALVSSSISSYLDSNGANAATFGTDGRLLSMKSEKGSRELTIDRSSSVYHELFILSGGDLDKTHDGQTITVDVVSGDRTLVSKTVTVENGHAIVQLTASEIINAAGASSISQARAASSDGDMYIWMHGAVGAVDLKTPFSIRRSDSVSGGGSCSTGSFALAALACALLRSRSKRSHRG